MSISTGETLGQVTLSSNGGAATAAVAGSPYALTIGNASGGSFNPVNYNLSYSNGQIVVTPRPLTVAVNSLVRFAGERNPDGSFGLSTNVGGLVNGDALTAGQTVAPPAASDNAAGVDIYALLPANVSFDRGTAGNYALAYSAGQLLVLPRPPQVGDGDTGTGGPVDLAVLFSAAERQAAVDELGRASSANRSTALLDTRPATPTVALQGVPTPAQISLLLSGDGQRITLPELQKLPLIVFDPQLRRLMQSADPR